MEPRVLAATSPEAVAWEPRQLAAAEHPPVAEDGPEDGLPPPCRPRLLRDDKSQTPPSVELHVVEMTFVDASDQTADVVSFFSAVADGDVAKVEALLQLPMNPDVSAWGGTPLMRAAAVNQTGVAQLLLEAGAQLDFCDSRGHTPLMDAAGAWLCRAAMVQLLLDAGAQRDLRNSQGRTALMLASHRGHAPVVRLLLEAGAQKDLRDNDGQTALMLATEWGHDQARRLLQ
ncbi:mask [Symbiodinium sp. CCMP2592]|nr:mask [Symbiodinium sp. CCMP2592]